MKCMRNRHVDSRSGEAGFKTRRRVLVSSSAVLVAFITGSLNGQSAGQSTSERRPVGSNLLSRDRSDKIKASLAQMRNADQDDRTRIMMQFRMERQQEYIESLRKELDIPEQEWALVRPRLEAVYNLKHPVVPMGGTKGPAVSEAQRIRTELRQCLDDKQSPTDRIQASLQAFRAAQEKTRQKLVAAQAKLREVLTLRQEARLVLRGLLE